MIDHLRVQGYIFCQSFLSSSNYSFFLSDGIFCFYFTCLTCTDRARFILVLSFPRQNHLISINLLNFLHILSRLVAISIIFLSIAYYAIYPFFFKFFLAGTHRAYLKFPVSIKRFILVQEVSFNVQYFSILLLLIISFTNLFIL